MSSWSTANLVEGTFWTGWSLLSFYFWSDAVAQRQAFDHIASPTNEKAKEIWKANKEVFTSTSSAISGGCMIGTWLSELELIPLGSLHPVVGIIGFGGSAVSAGFKSWDGALDLYQDLKAHFFPQKGYVPPPRHKLFQNMINVAFNVCVTAWAVFSASYVLAGGAYLSMVADQLLYWSCLLFFSNLTALFLLPEHKAADAH